MKVVADLKAPLTVFCSFLEQAVELRTPLEK